MSKLRRFLNPASIVYVGGSQMAGPIRASRRAGYQGIMYIHNPVKEEIEGIKCVKALSELPTPPDAAVVGLSPERAIAAVADLANANCGGAVVMSSGFAELNTDEGIERQKRLVDAAGDMPLLGPNCLGLINQFSGAFVWGDDNHCARQEGPAAAIISQSGALLIGMTGSESAFPLGYAFSIGNQAVTTTAELIEAILEDNRIRAIGLYIEGMNEGERFGKACLKALKQGVPVIALKGGDQSAGAAVSKSHTASMVVERDLWDAFKARFGIVEVSSPKALVETLKLVTVAGLPNGDRLSIISYSGGLNGLAATRCAKTGVKLPGPTERSRELLRQTLPETVAIANPLDLNIPYSASDGSISMRDTTGVAEAIIRFAKDVSDQIVFFIDIPKPGPGDLDRIWSDSLEALIEVRQKLGIPVTVAGILPEGLPEEFRDHMQRNGVAALLGYADSMEALETSIQIARCKAIADQDKNPASLISMPMPTHPRMLDEATSKHALSEFGLETPIYLAVRTADAGEAAAKLGFPVALKILSDQIPHKAKLGGVRLSLNSKHEVEAAANEMVEVVGNADGGFAVTHLMVEKMIQDANAEIIIGIKRHEALGLALVVGKGGTNTEEVATFETALLPLRENDLEQMFRKLQLDIHPSADALKTNCKAVESYALANAETLITLDVNPVMLTENGSAIATDALIVLGGNACV